MHGQFHILEDRTLEKQKYALSQSSSFRLQSNFFYSILNIFLPSIVEKHILIFLKILINYRGILVFSSYPIKLYEL